MTVTCCLYLVSYLGLILILAWMFNTSELDELFRILISIKGFKLRQPQWSNTTLLFPQTPLPDVLPLAWPPATVRMCLVSGGKQGLRLCSSGHWMVV